MALCVHETVTMIRITRWLLLIGPLIAVPSALVHLVDRRIDHFVVEDLVEIRARTDTPLNAYADFFYARDQLSQVRQLEIDGYLHRMRSVASLDRLDHLVNLRLRGTLVADVSALSSIPSLRTLDVTNCVMLYDVSDFSGRQNCKLRLSGTQVSGRRSSERRADVDKAGIRQADSVITTGEQHNGID